MIYGLGQQIAGWGGVSSEIGRPAKGDGKFCTLPGGGANFFLDLINFVNLPQTLVCYCSLL